MSSFTLYEEFLFCKGNRGALNEYGLIFIYLIVDYHIEKWEICM